MGGYILAPTLSPLAAPPPPPPPRLPARGATDHGLASFLVAMRPSTLGSFITALISDLDHAISGREAIRRDLSELMLLCGRPLRGGVWSRAIPIKPRAKKVDFVALSGLDTWKPATEVPPACNRFFLGIKSTLAEMREVNGDQGAQLDDSSGSTSAVLWDLYEDDACWVD